MATRGACMVILNQKQDQILLHKREDFRIWSLPGGRIEVGESAEAAAVREAYEFVCTRTADPHPPLASGQVDPGCGCVT